jgi:hypothetical protein
MSHLSAWPLSNHFAEKLVQGRWSEVRPPTSRELKATAILAMEIEEAAARIRSGLSDDDDSADAALDVWAGELPAGMRAGR